ncbi:hypothetical protein E1B28_002097 [Marasmius oreades]|uniref:Uncharacterized protein n=1 Tax=Marasmius oreades TaxID=181124 RepID=A0A9P7RMY2_9AGAR|nr:uncharacterized protein E1B28_002097 [Marasmius oreades]KAG7086138.1 hypothetical protein E1B28_002097 [Marasmius oreades]
MQDMWLCETQCRTLRETRRDDAVVLTPNGSKGIVEVDSSGISCEAMKVWRLID